ncbi:penicillin-binding protein 1C [uncultured Enterovirga sp.]|uniref:penicillin-binding protein 1C n=1 Tax=uncultured Enterovirga sp. TaxID=2026352 RepID=UPI0035CC4E10
MRPDADAPVSSPAGGGGPPAGWWRGFARRGWLILGAGLAASLILALATGFWLYATSLPPLDLTRAAQRSTTVSDRDDRLLRAFATKEGRWRLPVATQEVDPRYLLMLKAYEDRRFDDHPGIDVLALARASLQLVLHRRVVSGASTLSMQVARLLEPEPERSVRAKLRQIVRAVEIERRLGKSELLDLYLRLAPYGGNLEGVRAASLAYLGKEPKRLSNGEAALLVALPQSPEYRRPDRSPEVARRARDRVLGRAVAAGLISAADAEAARAEQVPHARRPFPMYAAHAAERALAERPDASEHRLSIDRRHQAALEGLLAERVERFGPAISGAIVVIDNGTGEVRARVGSPGKLAEERRGAIDMTAALRSPGSALKPFIYALAFESGLAHPETLVDDRPSRYGTYGPENFDLTYQGTVTARRALQLSLNVPAVELLNGIGAARFVSRLRQAGAQIAMPAEAAPGLAVGLGGLGISLVDLTRLYSGLARGGTAPLLVTRLDAGKAGQEGRVTEPVPAWYVADILRGAPPPDNAAGGRIAFKTGTSYGYRDAWAIGFDRRVTVGIWLGRPDGGAVPGLVGRLAAAPILFDAFARLGIEPEPVPMPPGALTATTATLPPPLRHVRSDIPKTLAATVQAPLRIAFPLDGSRVDLGAARSGGPDMPLALKVSGGRPPMTWLVNGAPIGEPDLRRSASWLPDGAGFARVSVLDAGGATDSVVVRIE